MVHDPQFVKVVPTSPRPSPAMRRARLTLLSEPELHALLDVYDAAGPHARSVECVLPPRYTILLLVLWKALEKDLLLPPQQISPLRIGRRRAPFLAASTVRFQGWRRPKPDAVRRYVRKLELLLAKIWKARWPDIEVPQLFERDRVHGLRLALELEVRGEVRESWFRDPPEDPPAAGDSCGASA